MATGSVLVIDDEKNIRRTLRMVLEGEGLEVRDAASAEDGLALIADTAPDVVITDLRLPGMSGVELLAKLRHTRDWAAIPVVVISGHAGVGDAVEAIKLGAADFFEKPLDRDRVVVSVTNALKRVAMSRELSVLREAVGVREEMVGDSAVMRRLFGEIEKVAQSRGRVLITGESGTGKELIARALHRLSPRREGPFVKVNCAAIPSELVESELFGHEKGAFTGAIARRSGYFEAADNGTLFLDEIGDMPLGAQAKVLRALQSGEVSRVGSDKVLVVDTRVIAATNRDLEAEVKNGRFREDLYFRLVVVPLRAPALRERAEDVPALVAAFVKEACRDNGVRLKSVEPEVIEELQGRGFPGNVRELKNLVERLVILSGDEITLDDLPEESVASKSLRSRGSVTEDDGLGESSESDESDSVTTVIAGGRLTLREHRDNAEREYITDTLRAVEWNISRAAAILGVERTNLHKKMRNLGVHRE